MGPVGISGFASPLKGRLAVKKLFATFLVGALVSMGCSSATSSKDTGKKGTDTGAGSTAAPTGSAGKMDTGSKMAPATTAKTAPPTEAKKPADTGKATSKATEKK
jgi:hypothetical protein